ncbi:MAG TPA: LAGLIDADG family homing endonuclease [Methanosarcinales archaeon]|nr:LAGLIDADG family homing endonuclease [Methanosarcinales archaeon]
MGKSTEIALAYCAGLIDGEGCIAISRGHTRSRSGIKYPKFIMQVVVELSGTPRPLEFLKGILGGIIYERKKGWSINSFSQGNKNKWRYFVWKVNSDAALEALKKIRKYLIIKPDQADIAIEFQNHMKRTRYKIKGNKDIPTREYRTNLYNKLKDIKHNRASVETKSSENESSSDSPILKEISAK